MKYFLSAFLFFALALSVNAQDDILSKAKFGMSGDELLTVFKNEGITRYNNPDNDNNNDNDDDDNDDDDNDDDNRSGYRIPSYTIDGNQYTVRFSMHHNKLKTIKFSLANTSSDKAADIYAKWMTTFNSKYGNEVHNHDYSGNGRTENERTWEGSGMKIYLHYFEIDGWGNKEKKRYCDISYSKD